MSYRYSFTAQTQDQRQILASGFLTHSPESGTLILPTGGGKSHLARVAIVAAGAAGAKAIYLAPTKALLQEQWRGWQDWLKQQSEPQLTEEAERYSLWPELEPEDQDEADWTIELDQLPQVGLFDSDHPAPPGAYEQCDILLMTPERLDICLRHESVQKAGSWIKAVRLIVVDEVHSLGDGHRGVRLEGALIRLRWLNPGCRTVALSATLSPEDGRLLDWIGPYRYVSQVRTVPLSWSILYYGQREQQVEALARLMRQAPCPTIVFVTSRSGADQLAQMLKRRGFQAQVHHAGRENRQRQEAEEGFQTGLYKVLVSTNTLGVGVNLPARRVVIYHLYRWAGPAEGWVMLGAGEVRQLGGRAGRPGLDSQGEAVLMAQTGDQEASKLLEAAQQSVFSQIESSLFSDRGWLLEQILALVSGGYSHSQGQIQAVLKTGLACHEEGGEQEAVGVLVQDSLQELVERLQQGRMLYSTSNNELQATELGAATSRQYLMPANALRWSLTLKTAATAGEQPHFVDWLALIGLELENRVRGLEILGNGAASLWLHNKTAAARLHCRTEPERVEFYYAQAALLRAWTLSRAQTDHLFRWTQDLGIRLYPNDLLRLVDEGVRLVEAIRAVAETIRLRGEPARVLAGYQGKLQVLSQMLTTGLNGPLVGLTLLNGIGPKRALQMEEVGLSSLAAVACAQPKQIATISGITLELAQQIVQQAAELQQTVNPEWFTD